MLSERFDSALLHDAIEDQGDGYPGGRDDQFWYYGAGKKVLRTGGYR
jgi:hypothetical protein